MAFISSGYNPAKPMEGRITDIGPHKYDEYFPPVIKKNFGKWLYHEILEPMSVSSKNKTILFLCYRIYLCLQMKRISSKQNH